MLSVTSSLQKVDGPELTASMIRDIHLACLAQANSEIPAAGATFAYRMISATHGPVRCTYTVKRSARTLLLVPEGKAAEYVLSGGAAKPPALRAEAKIGRESGGGGKA